MYFVIFIIYFKELLARLTGLVQDNWGTDLLRSQQVDADWAGKVLDVQAVLL